MRHAITAALLLIIAASGVAAAEDTDVKSLPGYVDLDRIEVPRDAEDLTLVDMTPSLLQLAASTTEDDPDLARALAMVRSLRVKSFSLDRADTDQLRPIIADIQAELERDGWDQLIYVRTGDELYTVSTKKEGDKVAGLMVVAFEPDDEATFVNVVGEIDLSMLLTLALGFEDGELGELIEELDDH